MAKKCKRGHARTTENVDKFGQCKKCRNMRSVIWSSKHPQRRQSAQLKSSYGISLEERDQRIRKQRGLCKVCRKKFSKKRKPFVDHVHDRTKKVRGILCRYCNTLLGSSFDDIKILLSAVKYLKESKKENTCLE